LLRFRLEPYHENDGTWHAEPKARVLHEWLVRLINMSAIPVINRITRASQLNKNVRSHNLKKITDDAINNREILTAKYDVGAYACEKRHQAQQ